MPVSRETKALNIACVCLVLVSGVIRLIGKNYLEFGYNIAVSAMLITAAFIWFFQIRRRIVQPDIRRNLTGVAAMLIFWMIIRTVKYGFTVRGDLAGRYCWYLYYVPLILIPLLMFLSVVQIGRPQNRPASRLWNLLYLPAAVLTVGVLTNDLHQLAFRFPKGAKLWSDANYIHGPVYYVVVAYMALLFSAILVITFSRCAVSANRKKIWAPAVPLFIMSVYTLLVVMKCRFAGEFMTMPDMLSFLLAAFMESLICVHLIPSNDRYGEIFQMSSIGAGIMDENGVIRYESVHSLPVTPEQVKRAQTETVFPGDENVALRSHPVNGGYGYWFRDISEISRLNRELSDLGDVLAEENAILDAENKMKEEREQIRQQNRLYDKIAGDVKKQLDKISSLIDNPPEDEEEFERTMKYACILNAYVKRRSNLVLLADRNGWFNGGELRLAISESLEYVRLYGVQAHGSYMVDRMFSGKCLLTAYELFEAALEAAVPGADAVLVNLIISEDELVLRMTFNTPRELLREDFIQKEIGELGGTLGTEADQQTEFICLSLPAGGERE